MPSLAGCGKSGLWSVDIDSEDDSELEPWSVTFSHPRICLQSAIRNLEILQRAADYLLRKEQNCDAFQLERADAYEVLITYDDEQRLLIRVGRPRIRSGVSFPWLLETSVDASEGEHLARALIEAVSESQE